MKNLANAHQRQKDFKEGRLIIPPKVKPPLSLEHMPTERIGKNGINWPAIRTAFISQAKPIITIGAEFGISKSVIKRRAKEGRWQELQALWHERAQQKVITKAENIIVDQSAKRFEELEALAQHIRIRLSEKDERGNAKILNPEMIQRLASALDTVIKNQRLIMGQSTSNVQMIGTIINRIMVVIEKYIPDTDRGRVADEFSRIVDTTAVGGEASPAGSGDGERAA